MAVQSGVFCRSIHLFHGRAIYADCCPGYLLPDIFEKSRPHSYRLEDDLKNKLEKLVDVENLNLPLVLAMVISFLYISNFDLKLKKV